MNRSWLWDRLSFAEDSRILVPTDHNCPASFRPGCPYDGYAAHGIIVFSGTQFLDLDLSGRLDISVEGAGVVAEVANLMAYGVLVVFTAAFD
ncbi:MAG: hypothetical protein AMXMBFR84_51300 [Candidatus Hydrogenedentota bacterium]